MSATVEERGPTIKAFPSHFSGSVIAVWMSGHRTPRYIITELGVKHVPPGWTSPLEIPPFLEIPLEYDYLNPKHLITLFLTLTLNGVFLRLYSGRQRKMFGRTIRGGSPDRSGLDCTYPAHLQWLCPLAVTEFGRWHMALGCCSKLPRRRDFIVCCSCVKRR